MDDALRLLLDAQIAELESKIERLIAADETLAEPARILRSILGIGPVASTMLIAETPELGQISAEQAGALAGLAPIAQTVSHFVESAQSVAGGACCGM
jgi:transposase